MASGWRPARAATASGRRMRSGWYTGSRNRSAASFTGEAVRSRAAVFGQQRGMHVDNSARRNIDRGLRNDLAVADHDYGIGLEARQSRDGIRPANALGLVYGQSKPSAFA